MTASSVRMPAFLPARWPAGRALAAALLCGLVLAGCHGSAAAPQAAAQSPTAAVDLQPLIDATPAGGVLTLAPGRYRGGARIGRPMTLDGAGQAVIDGAGHGTVLTVQADGVTVRGLRLQGSGDSLDQVDAGLQVEGAGVVVEDNTLVDVLFGLHLKGAQRAWVHGNQVQGKALAVGLRGDALRIWNGHHNRIEDNRFERARDLTLINSPDQQLRRNRYGDGRYGLHAVFSPRLLAEDNRLEHTGTGMVLLYSPQAVLRRNHIAHALTDGGAGLVLKESGESRLEDNEVLHCAVGLKLDTPLGTPERDDDDDGTLAPARDRQTAVARPQPGRLVVRGNLFAHNITGAFFYGEAGGDLFADNRWVSNLVTVAVSAPGAGSAHRWTGNDWDEYEGFDRNGDGIGDTPHEAMLYADRIWMDTPRAAFFRHSPALELLDFLERLAPFTSPYRLLRDAQPRMGAPVKVPPAHAPLAAPLTAARTHRAAPETP